MRVCLLFVYYIYCFLYIYLPVIIYDLPVSVFKKNSAATWIRFKSPKHKVQQNNTFSQMYLGVSGLIIELLSLLVELHSCIVLLLLWCICLYYWDFPNHGHPLTYKSLGNVESSSPLPSKGGYHLDNIGCGYSTYSNHH